MRKELSRVVAMGVVALAVVGFLTGAASAQPAPLPISMDEFGNGTGFDGMPMPGVMLPDPGPGGLPSTLTYFQPLGLVPGDLILLEPPQGGLSDIVRFSTNQGYFVFYSDIDDGADAPADVGFPTDRYPNIVSIVEGNNYTDYTPAPGQPGYFAGLPTLTYHIISDSDVPEPATITLFAVGAVGTFLLRRKMKK